MYGTEVSPSLISAITDAVSDEVKLWQARPLDALYPILYLDCIHVKVRDAGIWTASTSKCVTLALGLAAGSMLFVVSHEVIPETHRNGHQTSATIGLMAGFALMMVLDTTLG